MLEEVKKQLLNNPEQIQRILETFEFDKVRIQRNEIRCAFEYGTNPTAVVIRLQNNPDLFVKDYRNNVSYDLITYIGYTKVLPWCIAMRRGKYDCPLF